MWVCREYCDFCGKEFNHDKNGFTIQVGYSKGGWGNRKDIIPKSDYEICNECLKKLSKQVAVIKNILLSSYSRNKKKQKKM